DARDDWYALTPLGWATVVTWNPRFHRDRPGAAAALRAAGAQVDAFVAVLAGDVAALRAGADLTRRLGFVGGEATPLPVAAARRSPELVALPLELGADAGARTAFGLPPLAVALGAGDAAVAERLRAAGAADDLAAAVATRDPAAIAAAPVDAALAGR